MDIFFSVGLLLVVTGFWAWVIFFGGADRLEGTWLAEVFVHVGAGELKSGALKILTTAVWLAAIGFVIADLSMR